MLNPTPAQSQQTRQMDLPRIIGLLEQDRQETTHLASAQAMLEIITTHHLWVLGGLNVGSHSLIWQSSDLAKGRSRVCCTCMNCKHASLAVTIVIWAICLLCSFPASVWGTDNKVLVDHLAVKLSILGSSILP